MHFSQNWGKYLLSSAILVLSLFIFADYISMEKLYLFKDSGADSLVIYYPRWVHVVEYLRSDWIPTWSFNCGMGQNIFPAEMNDPFTMLLYLCGDRLAYAIIYVEILKLFAVGFIFYHYMRILNMSQYASSIGSLMVVFCGYMIGGSSGWYGHSTFVVYGVFWFYSFEQLYVRKNIFYFPLAVVLMSMTSLFFIYIFTVFLLLYSFLRFYTDNGWQAGGFLKLLARLAGLGLLGLAMNALFLLSPVMEMLNSPRISGESGHFNKLASRPVFGFAEPVEYLTIVFRFFSSDILGTGEKAVRYVNGQAEMFQSYQGWNNYFEGPLFYCSIPALLLAVQAFALQDRRRKTAYLLFASFWAFILVFPFFRNALYLFAGDYFKGGVNFIMPFLLVFFSMQALDRIDREGKFSSPLLAATALLLLSVLNLPRLLPWGGVLDRQILLTSSVLVAIYAALIWFMCRGKYRTTAKIVFALFLICELGWNSHMTANDRIVLSSEEFESRTGYNDHTVEALEYIRSSDKSFFRIQKDYISTPTVHINLNDSQVQGYYGTGSFNSFNSQNYIAFLSALETIDPKDEMQTRWAPGLTGIAAQSFASVKYRLSKSPDSNLEKFGYRLIHKTGDVLIYENTLSLPFGFAADTYMLEGEFSRLERGQKGFALLKGVVLSRETAGRCGDLSVLDPGKIPKNYTPDEYAADVAALRKNTLKIDGLSQKRISGTINVPGTRMLVFTFPYDRGWKATVDGKRTDLEVVDFGLTGLILPKGEHTVELRYRPPFIMEGAAVSLIGLLLYAMLAAVRLFPERADHLKTLLRAIFRNFRASRKGDALN
ncbi:MAG: hypothetical protein A2X45_12675 [Lentisphaerae bacterium GWF2_50_93]|nr:MAG: hypothetical protein A2X45_12675 [Lentisphaerae bacterium GWF2_50_93]